jgi:predicted Zn finger-like uncharacterized protein
MITYATCPACKTRLKVPEELAGQKRLAKCPSCAETFDLSTSDGPRAQRTQARANDDEVIDDLETVEDDDEPDEEPRNRRRRPRYEEDDDDRPVRRKRRKVKQEGGTNTWLIIGVAGGVALLLLIGCGIGVYALFGVKGGLAGLVDNPNVTKANFDRIEMGTPLQAVEGMIGPGAVCSDQEARDIIQGAGGGMPGMGQDQQIANNPGALGLTGWYRWKNGPTTLLVAVDGVNKVRVAALYTVTKNSSSRNWKSNVNVGGGGFPPPGRPGRGR